MDLLVVFTVLITYPQFSHSSNHQAWSHRVYLNQPYNISCHQDGIHLAQTSDLQWTRHGSISPLKNDDQFKLLPSESGVENAVLHIKNVTEKLSGFYLCHVRDYRPVGGAHGSSSGSSSGSYVVLRAINLGSFHLYHDNIDKYRSDIIRGIICSACFAFIVVGIGLLGTYRYLTEEQIAKRQERKDRYRSRRNRTINETCSVGIQDGVMD